MQPATGPDPGPGGAAPVTTRCATVLLGMSELSDAALRGNLEGLASRFTCNVVVFRVPPAWRPESVRRVLVPIRGGGAHSALRARVFASLRHRSAPDMEVEYLLVLSARTTPAERVRRERAYISMMRTEATRSPAVKTVLADDIGAAIVAAADGCDLLILGLSRVDRARRVFSETTRRVIASTECPTLVG